MGVRISPARIDRELARRGWSATDLARASGCSASTISGARRGRQVTNETLSKIAGALLNAPVVPGVDVLLEPENGPLAEASANGHEHPGLVI
ncbi:MAG: Cro/C1-type DNA-binding domain [Chloroflexota bacterium]|jgi:transcriptional regulator with XRE-family HTH domain|nr:Cro/C1-type DNA-binding domain [Chloroflexota bacterium]